MHVIELDLDTEKALNHLTQMEGKMPDEWLKETLVQLIKSQTHSQRLPSMAEFRASLPMQEKSAGDFCREMRDGERY
jgi:hypothetical protein